AFLISDSDKPVTALIPAAIGGLFLVFGALQLPDQRVLRMVVAHLAVLAAALLPIGVVMRWIGGEFGTPLAFTVQAVTLVLLWGYVALGVRSFIAARRARKEGVGFEVVT
ncbi:MAG: hypothetical protein AAF743_01245, partial [Planctomycetota bacterium]